MFHFVHPSLLLLLLAVPLLLWWWLRRRGSALRYPALGPLAALPAGRTRFARWVGGILRAAGFTLLIVAMAGPRWADPGTRLPTEGIAIMMIVDVSGSMADEDFAFGDKRISRLDAVKNVFRLFVAGGDGPDGQRLIGRPDDLVGLTVFGTKPECICPLTLSHSVLLEMLDREKPRRVPGESETNISDANALGLHRLQSAGPRRKVLVLLSDGEHNVPNPQSEWKPRQAAQIAANLDIPIYTIDAGGETKSALEPGVKQNAEIRSQGIHTLRELARITNGRYFQAHDTKSLLNVCQEIDQLERTQIQSFRYLRYSDGYAWFGLASLVAFVFVYSLEMTVWRRLP